MRQNLKTLSAVLGAACLWACSAPGVESKPDAKTAEISTPNPIFHAKDNPKSLSDWGVLASNGQTLQLAKNNFIYELKTPLFSDYASKLRTIYMPDGSTSHLDSDNDRIIFPVGTIITKSFYYPKGDTDGHVKTVTRKPEVKNGILDISNIELIETRLLVRRTAGWDALPYVWNDDQTQAKLSRTGDIQKFDLNGHGDFAYVVPNVNQCAGCHATNHTTKKIVPIGPRLRHLTSLDNMRLENVPADFPQNADWKDTAEPLNNRARAYLDINCSHCHNKVGPADTSGLHLEPGTPLGQPLGLCKPPIAAGTGTGNRKHGIVPGKAEESIFTYRLASTNPAEMMPELGRSLSHKEGVALIEEWINAMDGDCAG